jgi:nucleobase:cation symporter-1, NCS1 family
MLIGAGVSIWLFANQTEYIGLIPKHWPSAGDLTFEVGSLLTAVIYLTWRLIEQRSASTTLTAPTEPAPRA